MDPKQLGSVDWNQISQAIYLTALFAFSWVVFLGCLILAQAVLPSLVATGHLRPGVGRGRFLLYPVALIALSTAVLALFRAAVLIRGIIDFYPRFWQ